MSRGIVLLLLAQGLAGCDSSTPSRFPLAPSPVPQAVPNPPQPAGIQLTGYVLDTAFRPLAGASLEVVDGPQTGSSATSDGEGRFSLTGTFNDTTRVRATKEGHVTATGALIPSCASCNPSSRFIYFYLAVLVPPVNIAGDYTLTLTADSTCADLPNDVRTRTYAATITPESRSDSPANAMFVVAASGASFPFEDFHSFSIGVAGDYLGFGLDGGHNPFLVEQVAPNTYLAFSGSSPGASVGTGAVSTIATSFDGLIEYCELKTAPGRFYNCSLGQAVVRAQCLSKNHQLILTRR